MNQAIKLNPNFSAAFMDRGIVSYDKHDYDRAVPGVDASIAAKAGYAVSFGGRGASYENRREGDRIIQEASAAVRNAQYNAFAYSPDTFPPAYPPLIASAQAEPPRPAQRAPVAANVPLPEPAPEHAAPPVNPRVAAPDTRRKPAAPEADARRVKRPPMPTPSPHRAQQRPPQGVTQQRRQQERVSQQRHPRVSQPRRVVVPQAAALSRAAAERRQHRGPLQELFAR
jgi:hypothetical protein